MKFLFAQPTGLLAAVLLASGCASSQSDHRPHLSPIRWEYWSASGPAQPIMPGAQTRIEAGWEVVVFSISGPASDPYAVVTLRRPKK